MTSRIKPKTYTIADEKKIFEAALKDAVELGLRPSPMTVLGNNIQDCLAEVAAAYPRTDAPAVAKARKAFAAYAARYRS
ncbi:hypothetical protein [Mycolicibacter sinensis]|uniref:hypothetical protein n=1 Tax=Mycolicibacter sinensis (strain JDM601) TaxID=875328 RepID=UPI00104230CA|nr:hypothetical protein [Mycolicibacter sinensis]